MGVVVLVAGATGGVGKRVVVQQMVERSYQVRALRDADKAREILGDDVELVVGDITKPEFQSLKGFVSTQPSLLRK